MKKIIILYLIFFNYLTYASDSKIDCDNAYTQFDMNYCANEDFKKADKELNQLYQEILKYTSEEETNLLKKSQNLWIKLRDADCEFGSFQVREGTVFPMILSMCLAGKTKVRIEELKNILECSEGDLSCRVLRNR